MEQDFEQMVEVKLRHPDDFLKVIETLTRIGVPGNNNTLYQSCHILHKRGRYFIVHFKEMFKLDGKRSDFNEEDRQRRNTIASLLEQWNLVELVNGQRVHDDKLPVAQVKIISFSDKSNWNLIPKYNMGRK